MRPPAWFFNVQYSSHFRVGFATINNVDKVKGGVSYRLPWPVGGRNLVFNALRHRGGELAPPLSGGGFA